MAKLPSPTPTTNNAPASQPQIAPLRHHNHRHATGLSLSPPPSPSPSPNSGFLHTGECCPHLSAKEPPQHPIEPPLSKECIPPLSKDAVPRLPAQQYEHDVGKEDLQLHPHVENPEYTGYGITFVKEIDTKTMDYPDKSLHENHSSDFMESNTDSCLRFTDRGPGFTQEFSGDAKHGEGEADVSKDGSHANSQQKPAWQKLHHESGAPAKPELVMETASWPSLAEARNAKPADSRKAVSRIGTIAVQAQPANKVSNLDSKNMPGLKQKPSYRRDIAGSDNIPSHGQSKGLNRPFQNRNMPRNVSVPQNTHIGRPACYPVSQFQPPIHGPMQFMPDYWQYSTQTYYIQPPAWDPIGKATGFLPLPQQHVDPRSLHTPPLFPVVNYDPNFYSIPNYQKGNIYVPTMSDLSHNSVSFQPQRSVGVILQNQEAPSMQGVLNQNHGPMQGVLQTQGPASVHGVFQSQSPPSVHGVLQTQNPASVQGVLQDQNPQVVLQSHSPTSVQTVMQSQNTTSVKALILKQIEYYFSTENLCKDMYLRSKMDNQGFVPVSLIASFNRVQKLTSSTDLILSALRNSSVVEVKGDMIRKYDDWERWLLPKADLSFRSNANNIVNGDPKPKQHFSYVINPGGRIYDTAKERENVRPFSASESKAQINGPPSSPLKSNQSADIGKVCESLNNHSSSLTQDRGHLLTTTLTVEDVQRDLQNLKIPFLVDERKCHSFPDSLNLTESLNNEEDRPDPNNRRVLTHGQISSCIAVP